MNGEFHVLTFLILVVLCVATYFLFRIYDQMPELVLRVTEQQRALAKIQDMMQSNSNTNTDDADSSGAKSA